MRYLVVFAVLALFLVGLAASGIDASVDPQVTAVENLMKRILPQRAIYFSFELAETSSTDISTIQAANGRVHISGSSGVALAGAVYHYLKYSCNASISWFGNQLDLPTPLPSASEIVKSPYRYRYMYNTCTYGYSTAFWDWPRWEREIDLLALWGINMPLAQIGQEFAFLLAYRELGLSDADVLQFFSGPAFFPWQRMGNIYGWQGPVSNDWLESQVQLQKRIVARMREFGMMPILPAFAGYVPPAMKLKFPSAKIVQLSPWADHFNGTYFLDPTDPLFQNVGKLYMKYVTQLYGSQNHFYSADPFNEETPPTADPQYLSAVSKGILQAMTSVDPDAVWVMQGWFLVNNHAFWTPEAATALLNAVPVDKLIMLDLWAEVKPIWSQTDNFYGRNFIWNMLHNFGGRSGLYGQLFNVAANPPLALSQSSNFMIGTGMTPEAIEQNPIVYELMAEMGWQASGVQLSEWIPRYVHRRYGARLDEAVGAWMLLLNSVYNCTTGQEGTSGSVIALRPAFDQTRLDCCATLELYYDPVMVQQAWTKLQSVASTVGDQATYQYDLIQVAQQVMSNYALQVYNAMNKAFADKNVTAFASLGATMLQLVNDTERLAASSRYLLVGTWIADARRAAAIHTEQVLFEENARRQITLWGSKDVVGLHEYAYHLWSGVVRDFYYPRWHAFVQGVNTALKDGTPWDQNAYVLQMQQMEEEWVKGSQRYEESPVGDTVKIAQELYSRYVG
eukprot:TRINITY_DN8770_c0_g1_i1.p1 TRINITY_DN8770_c0_g1~~TRINITY_DN8770_c0_g1_i1.p1  ORF type:complete len:734 (-),score=141.60 TRINITY_DN8770_c0_g1_i1:24-2225(-)